MPKYYAKVTWSIEDLINSIKDSGGECEKDFARKWWDKNEKCFRNRIIECGFEILKEMVEIK